MVPIVGAHGSARQNLLILGLTEDFVRETDEASLQTTQILDGSRGKKADWIGIDKDLTPHSTMGAKWAANGTDAQVTDALLFLARLYHLHG